MFSFYDFPVFPGMVNLTDDEGAMLTTVPIYRMKILQICPGVLQNSSLTPLVGL